MTRDDFVALGAMAVGSVLLPVLVATGFGWNAWLCVFLGALGLLATALVARNLRYRRHQERLRAAVYEPPPVRTEPASPPPPSYGSQVSVIPVPSNELDYHFLFSATVRWEPMHGTVDAEAFARKAVLDRTCELTRFWPPGNPALAQISLAAELGFHRPDQTHTVTVWAEAVSLSLADDDRDRLTKLATLRKEKLVWEHERGFEISKREYLGNDVLRSPGSAVVWKLAQDYGQIVDTVELIPTLRRLTAAANDHDLPATDLDPGPVLQPSPEPLITEENAWQVDVDPSPSNGFHPEPADPVETFVAGVFGDEDSGQRDLFAEHVATLVDKHGRMSSPRPDEPQNPPATDSDDEALPNTPSDPSQEDTEWPDPDVHSNE